MSSDYVEEILRLLPFIDQPLLASGAGTTWPALQKWNLDYLAHNLEEKLNFRMGRKICNNQQWECDAIYVLANVNEFRDWVQKGSSCSTENPFHKFSPDDWWAYAAYLHMSEYPSLAPLKDDIPWNRMFSCLPNVGESTFWLGTSGSHTACHYDTYGINFVLQIFGRKRWILFPLTDTPCLYPTRLPLEESTVFSQVNFHAPDLVCYPMLLNSHPRVVTLEPGDVLFVPRHWWHFVESPDQDEATCAVNMWLDQPHIDEEERCKEALIQLAGFSLLHAASDMHVEMKHNLHVTEQELAQSPNWFRDLTVFIQASIESSKEGQKGEKSPNRKLSKKDSPISWQTIPPTPVGNIFSNPKEISLLSPTKGGITPEAIIRAFLDPEVVELVYRKLRKR